MKRKITGAAIIVLLILATIAAPACVCFASQGSFDAGSITIQGKHFVDGNETLKSGRHTFVLTAANARSPMPEGSVDGVKKVTVSSGEAFDFGPIYFQKPGKYEYTVTREITPSENLKQDDSVYHVTISVFSDETATIVYEKEGTTGKPDKIEYIDEFISEDSTVPEEGTTVAEEDNTEVEEDNPDSGTRTGDDMFLRGTIIVMAAAILAILLIVVVSRRRQRNQ